MFSDFHRVTIVLLCLKAMYFQAWQHRASACVEKQLCLKEEEGGETMDKERRAKLSFNNGHLRLQLLPWVAHGKGSHPHKKNGQS